MTRVGKNRFCLPSYLLPRELETPGHFLERQRERGGCLVITSSTEGTRGLEQCVSCNNSDTDSPETHSGTRAHCGGLHLRWDGACPQHMWVTVTKWCSAVPSLAPAPRPRWTTWIRKASARWSTVHWGATATFCATCWPASGRWARPSQARWGRAKPRSRRWRRPPAWATARWVRPSPGHFWGNGSPVGGHCALTFFQVAGLWCTEGMKGNEGFQKERLVSPRVKMPCCYHTPPVSGSGQGAGELPAGAPAGCILSASFPRLPSLFCFHPLHFPLWFILLSLWSFNSNHMESCF